MTLEGTVFGGKYRIVRLVGEGGMGAVYEAEHVEIKRRLAIKVMQPALAVDPVAVARFRREALAAGSLGHDHICAALDVGEGPDGAPYLVMDLLRGESLAALLARVGPLSPRRALSIAAQVLDALACAHDAGVVHRDLKPENVFLARLGEVEDFVRVLDFGVSKFLGEDPPVTGATGTGRVVGTPHYMAPEQARGQKDQDHRVDVYAAGVLLFEMATGRVPFQGDGFSDLLVRIATDPFPAPRALRPDLTADYEAIVLRAVARHRGDRYADARAMRVDVLRARGASGEAGDLASRARTIPTAAGLPSPLDPKTPSHLGIAATPPRRTRAWIALLGASAIAALVAAAFAFGRTDRPARAETAAPPRAQSVEPVPADEPERPGSSMPAAQSVAPEPASSAPITIPRARVRPRTASAPPPPAGEKLDFAR